MAVIEMQGIVKVYPNGVAANDGINFSVARGEIHALVGENGAGKTTLMKILYGIEQPNEGTIWMEQASGESTNLRFHSSHEAIAAGIGMVHQNFMLVPSFTVAENVVLGQEPTRKGLIDKQRSIQITNELSRRYGLRVDAEAIVDSINVGMRQRVEILKTLYRGAQIIILDEPTAVLTPQETQDLFTAIKGLVNQGKTVIFITHKLREVKEISDRVTVLRNGRAVGTVATSEATREELARMMVGRDVFLSIDKPRVQRGPIVLEVANLSFVSETGRTLLDRVSFRVYQGEILGVAGVEGNGQTELVEVLTGLRSAAGGSARLNGVEILNQSPRAVRLAGIAHIPEDRLTNGLGLRASINENILIDRYFQPPYLNGMFINSQEVKALGEQVIDEYGIRCPDGNVPVNSLSGGNMQKVIVAREFTSNPRLLIAAQPTRGIDVGATEFVRERLIRLRTAGTAILLVSADLGEVMSLSDRMIVIYEGQITGVFPDVSNLSEAELGMYMLGIKRQTPGEIEEQI